MFGLCDSTTSYVLNLLTYYGKETSYNPECDADSGQAKKVFHTLLAPFEGVGYYGIFNRKSRKWWKKIFHWIVEITQHNSHILHILATEKKIPRASFKRWLVAEMTELASQKLTEAEKAGPKKNAAGCKAANPIERLTGNKHLVALSD